MITKKNIIINDKSSAVLELNIKYIVNVIVLAYFFSSKTMNSIYISKRKRENRWNLLLSPDIQGEEVVSNEKKNI